MKKIASLLVLMMVVASLSACVPGKKKSYIRIKCPTCGYEFDSPSEE